MILTIYVAGAAVTFLALLNWLVADCRNYHGIPSDVAKVVPYALFCATLWPFLLVSMAAGKLLDNEGEL